jgi:chromosome segregation ATPase
MEWLKSKATVVAVCSLALIGFEGYWMMSTQIAMEERMKSMETSFRSMNEDAQDELKALSSDLEVVTKKMGITAKELQQAQKAARQLQQENADMSRRLRREMSTKADSEAVMKLHQESASKLDTVQKEAATRMDGISGDVTGVRTDLETTRSDLKATRDELVSSRRDLGTLIARNSGELAELRRKGERDYIEFDIAKSKQYARVGDILVQLRKTDVKRQKYELAINADDSSIIKKDRTANEPVTFLVGRDRTRYELVVNYVDKDRIRGYLSTPKDKKMAADALSLRLNP